MARAPDHPNGQVGATSRRLQPLRVGLLRIAFPRWPSKMVKVLPLAVLRRAIPFQLGLLAFPRFCLGKLVRFLRGRSAVRARVLDQICWHACLYSTVRALLTNNFDIFAQTGVASPVAGGVVGLRVHA